MFGVKELERKPECDVNASVKAAQVFVLCWAGQILGTTDGRTGGGGGGTPFRVSSRFGEFLSYVAGHVQYTGDRQRDRDRVGSPVRCLGNIVGGVKRSPSSSSGYPNPSIPTGAG